MVLSVVCNAAEVCMHGRSEHRRETPGPRWSIHQSWCWVVFTSHNDITSVMSGRGPCCTAWPRLPRGPQGTMDRFRGSAAAV